MTYVKVLLAAALGAFAGATLSLELAAHVGLYELMWLPGMLVGGALGWVSVSPMGVGAAFLNACRQSARAVPERARVQASVAALPNKMWRVVTRVGLAFTVAFPAAVYTSLASFTFWATASIYAGSTLEEVMGVFLVLHLLVVVILSVPGMVLLVVFGGSRTELVRLRRLVMYMPLTLFVQAVFAVAWSTFYVIVAIQQAIAHVPFALRWVRDVGATTYRYADTHQRAYAATFTAVGAVVGHFAYDALIGAAAGVVGAIVSYGVLWVLHRTFAVRAK